MANNNHNAGYGLIKAIGTIAQNTTGSTFVVALPTQSNYQELADIFTPNAYGEARLYPSIQTAHDMCVANRGDVIVIAPGYTETVTAAGGITLSTAGVKVIALGTGSLRPTITFSTSTAASMLISGAGVSVSGLVGVAGINALTKPFDITANDVSVDVEFRDGSASVEAASVIRATSVSRLAVNLKHKGFIAGSAGVNPIQLNGVSGARINVDFYGKASTAVVNFVTTLSTDVIVSGSFYNSGTALTKNIVDTITGSIWTATGFDGVGAYSFSGGSSSALAADDVSAVSSALTVPAPDATTNVNERDVVGNKTDAAVATVGTTNSIMAYLKGAINYFIVPTADVATNASVRDVVGNKSDATVTTIGTVASIIAYVKGLLSFSEKQAVSTTAVMVNGNTIFTATGDVQILGLVSECITGNDATASTIQYQTAPTVGAATTISGASASLANALAGASVSLLGTSLATAPNLVASGGNLGMTAPIYCPAGTIKLVVAVGSTTGTWKHYLRYRPLEAGATVS